MATSTLTAQQLIDYARLFSWCTPAIGVAGYNDQPALSFLQEVIQELMSESNPWKWNASKLAAFRTQPYQYDYPTNVSQNTMGWLQAAVAVDINATSTPKIIVPLTCVHSLLPTFIVARPQKLSWIPNAIAQTATWGGGGRTDPGANTVYKDPLTANGGGPGSNPIAAITDTNGNIQVVTTYGTTGATQPAWPAASSAAGVTTADGTVVWTVQDPNGVALRLDAAATFNSVVWEIRALYQNKPPVITGLTQVITPIPDDLSYLVKQGFLAFCYKQAKPELFAGEFQQWLLAIRRAMGSSDREYQEFGMYPASPIQGGYGDGMTGAHGYPGHPGWS